MNGSAPSRQWEHCTVASALLPLEGQACPNQRLDLPDTSGDSHLGICTRLPEAPQHTTPRPLPRLWYTPATHQQQRDSVNGPVGGPESQSHQPCPCPALAVALALLTESLLHLRGSLPCQEASSVVKLTRAPTAAIPGAWVSAQGPALLGPRGERRPGRWGSGRVCSPECR